MEKVVITGMGAVCSLGDSVIQLLQPKLKTLKALKQFVKSTGQEDS